MPDTKITALTAIGANPIIPATFPIPMVDLTDTSMAASGTTKKVTVNQILGAGGTATLASATITGDLTVRTTGLIVNATGTGVQVSPSAPLCVKTRNSDSVGLRVLQSTGGTSGIQFTDDPVTADWGSILATSANLFLRSNSLLQLQTGGATERLAISSTGVCTWSNVGGVAGTAMTLNSTGLGVGVTPSAWAATFKPIDIGSGCLVSQPANQTIGIFANAFGNGTNYTRKANGLAAGYDIFNGAHYWLNAPTGTAGTTFAFGNAAMTLDASGNLLVGTSGTSWQTVAGFYYFAGSSLNVTRDGNACQLLNRLTSDGIIVDLRRSANAVGNISVTTTGATFNSTSDYRLKESVAPLSDGLARVNALKPSVYKWKSNGSDGEGFLAHELAEVVPAAVNGEKDAVNEDGTIKAQSIDMSRIVPILVAAIKELSAEVNALKNA